MNRIHRASCTPNWGAIVAGWLILSAGLIQLEANSEGRCRADFRAANPTEYPESISSVRHSVVHRQTPKILPNQQHEYGSDVLIGGPFSATYHDRLAQWAQSLRDSPAAERAAQVQAREELPSNAHRERERELAMELWAAADPVAALKHVEKIHRPLAPCPPTRRTGDWRALARGWARNAPATALDWARQQPVRDDFDLVLVVLLTVAEADPAKALRWYIEDPAPDSVHDDRALPLFQHLILTGQLDAAQRGAGQLPLGELRSRVHFFLAQEWAQIDLAAARNWAEKQSDQPDASHRIAGVAIVEARDASVAALRWVAAQPRLDERARLLSAVVSAGLQSEPTLQRLEELRQTLPETDRASLWRVAAAVPELVAADPTRLIQEAWALPREAGQQEALLQAYVHWKTVSAAAARADLESHAAQYPETVDNIRSILYPRP
jgi:hypothetical protein